MIHLGKQAYSACFSRVVVTSSAHFPFSYDAALGCSNHHFVDQIPRDWDNRTQIDTCRWSQAFRTNLKDSRSSPPFVFLDSAC